jgi:SAM-dependent methyltransferase
MAEKTHLKAVTYQDVLERLERTDTRLALAAAVVEALHPSAAAVANDILGFCAHRYPDTDLLGAYTHRAAGLEELQKRLDTYNTVEYLGDPAVAIPRDRYNISLLLSIALTNHRFEIMRELSEFLRRLAPGIVRVASVGTGTGFELRLLASILPAAVRIESYDIDPTAEEEAMGYLRFFGVERKIVFGSEYPLEQLEPALENSFDALILCELLEHLRDPARALAAVRSYLTEKGHAFLTMAVNIAQEDHIFLYEDIESCRRQIRQAGLDVAREWITPQTVTIPPDDQTMREIGFRKGNYVADVVKSGTSRVV